MSILERPRPAVQPSMPPRDPRDPRPAGADRLRTIPAEVVPPAEAHEAGCEPWPFTPDADDLAWDTGFTVGLEDGVYDLPWGASPRAELNFAMGRRAGREARESAAARELGYALGLRTGIGEPPGGYAPHEAAAYREGFAEGEAERDRLEARFAEYDAWLDSLASERISESDVWPYGVC